MKGISFTIAACKEVLQGSDIDLLTGRPSCSFKGTVDQSTITGVNISELCGLHDGTVKVPVYDWVTFLEPYFKNIPGISKFHHFRLTKEHPGVVFCRKLLS